MLNTSENMSALEWFFRKPAEANFPQNTSSTELRQLRSAIDKLAFALTSYQTTSDASTFARIGLSFSEKMGEINNAEQIDKAVINDLVDKIKEVILLLKKPESINQPPNLIEGLNNTVIALILLAKSSHDVDFRTNIISLAKVFSEK